MAKDKTGQDEQKDSSKIWSVFSLAAALIGGHDREARA